MQTSTSRFIFMVLSGLIVMLIGLTATASPPSAPTIHLEFVGFPALLSADPAPLADGRLLFRAIAQALVVDQDGNQFFLTEDVTQIWTLDGSLLPAGVYPSSVLWKLETSGGDLIMKGYYSGHFKRMKGPESLIESHGQVLWVSPELIEYYQAKVDGHGVMNLLNFGVDATITIRPRNKR